MSSKTTSTAATFQKILAIQSQAVGLLSPEIESGGVVKFFCNFTTYSYMRKYRLVAKKGEGTFSEVLRAQNVKDGKYHAIKCMKNRFDNIDQVSH